MKIVLESIAPSDDELRRTGGGRVSMKVFDDHDDVTDIYEGPHRFLFNIALKLFDPDTKLGVRKIHK